VSAAPPSTASDVEALRRAWEDQMEIGHDSLPPWYWSRPQREARRDAWVAERLNATPLTPIRSRLP